MTLRDNQVILKFAPNISSEHQAKSMLTLEKYMRMLTNQEIEVFKEAMADDSKLRAKMSDEQRAKL